MDCLAKTLLKKIKKLGGNEDLIHFESVEITLPFQTRSKLGDEILI